MKRSLAFFVLVSILALSAGHASAKEVLVNRVLVRVNSDIITQYDLDEAMKPVLAQLKDRQLSAEQRKQIPGLYKQMLDKMVREKLLAQEIEKYGIQVSEDQLDQEVQKILDDRMLTHDQFVEMIKKDGLDEKGFRDKLRNSLEMQQIMGHMVQDKVVVTESEIQAEYEKRKSEYSLGRAVSLDILMLPTDVSVEEVLKRIKDGEMDFAQAVTKYSVGPGKEEGGSIGEVNWKDLTLEWKDALEGVEKGGISRPLTVQGHQALLHIRDVIEGRVTPFADVKKDLEQELLEKKREEVFDAYFEDLKKQAVIEYLTDDLVL